MPIEIRELIIEGHIAPTEGQADTLTPEDISRIKEEVIESLLSSGVLTVEKQRELKEETLREVRKMLEDRWRR